ncbi:MAG: hypothetical protein M3Q39_09980 [Actinomycetota bacterium]|nr:hypothetical protein [Actinomycetota bacterium]
MAGRQYSAGRIFLDVIPSFKGVMQKIDREVGEARKRVAEADEKAAGESAEKIGRTTGRARTTADRETNAAIRAQRNQAWRAMSNDEKIAAIKAERARRARMDEEAKDDVSFQVDNLRRLDRTLSNERQRLAKAERARELAEDKAFLRLQEDIRAGSWKRSVADAMEAAKAENEGRARLQAMTLNDYSTTARKMAQQELAAASKSVTQAAATQRAKNAATKREMDAFDREFNGTLKETEKKAAESAKRSGGRFGQEMRKALNASLLDLPEVQIDVDSSRADVEVDKLRRRIETLRDTTVTANFDGRRARSEIRALEREASRLSRRRYDLAFRTNAKSVAVNLRELREEMNAGSRASGDLANRHSNNAQRALDGANAFRAFNIVILAAALIIPTLIPAIAGLAAVIGGLVPLLLGAAAGVGVLLLAFSGIGDAVKAMGDQQDNAAKDALGASKTMRNAARGVRDAEQGIATARRTGAQAAADSARRVKDAQTGLVDAQERASEMITDALGRQKAAQDGVGEAQERSAELVANALRRQSDAQTGATDAQQRATELVTDAAARQKAAQEGIAAAQERSTRSITDALRRQTDAQDGVVAAQARAKEMISAAAAAQRSAQAGIGEAQERAADRTEDALRRQSDAVRSLTDAQERAVSQVESALRRQESAERSLTRAQEDTRRAIMDVTDARRQARQELEDYVLSMQGASLGVEGAEISLERAVIRAQEVGGGARPADMSAREWTEEGLTNQQLDFVNRSDKYRMANKDKLRLTDEQKSQGYNIFEDYTIGRPDAQPAGTLEAREADLAVRQAQLRLKEAREENEDVRAEAAAARKAGVEGSDLVVEAKSRLLAAQTAETDAERNAREAVADVTKARVDGERSVADAKRDLADADESLVETRIEGLESIAQAEADAVEASQNLAKARTEGAEVVADARRDLTDAEADLTRARTDGEKLVASAKADAAQAAVDLGKARVDAARMVSDAERDLTDANADLTKARVDGEELVTEAKAEAAQAAIDLGKARVDAARVITDAEQNITDALANQQEQRIATGESMREARERLVDAEEAYQEALQQTGEIGSASQQKLRESMDALSPAGQRFAEFLFSLGPALKELRAAAQEGLLPGVQEFMEDMISTYGPGFLDFVGRMSSTLGDFFTGPMTDTFNGQIMRDFFSVMDQYAPTFTTQVGMMILELLDFVAAIATAFAPFGVTLGDGLIDMISGWTDWAEGLQGSPAFEAFLAYVLESGPLFLEMLKQFSLALINIGVAFAPYADDLIIFFTKIFEFIANMDPALLGAIVAGILALIIGLQTATGIMSGATLVRLFFGTSKGGGFANPFALVTLGVVILTATLAILVQEYDWARAAMERVKQVGADLFEWAMKYRGELALLAVAVVGGYVAFRVFSSVMLGARVVAGVLQLGLLAVRIALLGISWPIVAVIAGIALLIGALVWLYNNNATFAAFVDRAWAGIKAAFFATINWIVEVGIPAVVAAFWWLRDGFMDVWNNYLWPAIQAIGAAFVWLYENGVLPVVGWIVAAWNGLVEGIVFAWNRWGAPIMEDIFAAFQWFADLVSENIVPAVMDAWNIFATTLRLIWEGIILPTIEAAGDAFAWLWENAIQPALEGIGEGIAWLWDNFLEGFFADLGDGLVVLGDAFMWLWNNIVAPVFEGIGDIIEGAWDNVINPIFDALSDGVDAVAEAFDGGASLIESVWAGIVEVIAGPLQTVLGWIERYFIDPLNDMLSAVGIDWEIPFPNVPTTLPSAKINPATRRGGGNTSRTAAADGGVLPGYSPGHDNLRFMSARGDILDLSGGEPILRPEVGRVLGKPWVDGVNNAARGGGVQGVKNHLGFATGGVFPAVKRNRNDDWQGTGNLTAGVVNTGDGLWKALTTVADFIANPVSSMKEVVSGLIAGAPGKNTLPGEMVKGIYSTVAKKAAAKAADYLGDASPSGITPGGSFQSNGGGMGWQKQAAIAKSMVPGIRITDSVRAAGRKTASGYLSYHAANNNGGRAVDLGGTKAQMDQMFRLLVSTYGKSSPEIYYGPGGSAYKWGKRHFLTGVTAATHPFNHVHWAHKMGGLLGEQGGLQEALWARKDAGFTGTPNVGVYDNGGILGPGDIGINLKSSPERITNDSQWAKIEAAALGGGGGGGVTYAPQLTSINGATAQEVVQEISWEVRKLERGHRGGRS